MKRSRTLKRRQVLAALAAVPILSCGRGPGAEFRFFTDEEARLLAAFCDRLIPPDDAAGAAQAGVVHFIDIQLTGSYKRHQKIYRTGLRSVASTSFADLPTARQAELLAAFERNEGAGGDWKEFAPRQFFELVLAHTMQGFYGSPRHGGNAGGASWKMLGVPNPPVRGRLHYEV